MKNSLANTGDITDAGSIPGSGRSPGDGSGYPLQYSCLEKPRDRGAWWATVHGATKSRAWLEWLSTPVGCKDIYSRVCFIQGCSSDTLQQRLGFHLFLEKPLPFIPFRLKSRILAFHVGEGVRSGSSHPAGIFCLALPEKQQWLALHRPLGPAQALVTLIWSQEDSSLIDNEQAVFLHMTRSWLHFPRCSEKGSGGTAVPPVAACPHSVLAALGAQVTWPLNPGRISYPHPVYSAFMFKNQWLRSQVPGAV